MNTKEQALELLKEAQASFRDCLESLERYIALTNDEPAKRYLYDLLSRIDNNDAGLSRYNVVNFDTLMELLPEKYPASAKDVQEWAIAHADEYADDDVVNLDALIEAVWNTLKVDFNAEQECYEVEGTPIGYLVERTLNEFDIEYF